MNKSIFSTLLLFLLVFSLFFYWGYSLNFPDPDSFYHTKIALLTAQQGPVLDFPWQQFTLLKDNFIDHHFLYHVILIPFVIFQNPLIGAKIATFFLSSGFILVFYFFLKSQKIKFALAYSLLLALITPFSFRLNLTKASALSLILFFIGYYLIIKKKYYLLALLSFIYVWSYGGFAVILLLGLIYIISELILTRKFNYKILLSILSGLALGITINPYFPQNLSFYWQQFIQIGVLNYQDKIGVGGEWYPYGFWQLISQTPVLSLLFIISLIIFFKNYKKINKINLTAFILSLVWLILTLKSRRYIEYYVPNALFFIALTFTQIKFKKLVRTEHCSVPSLVLLFYFLLIVPIFFTENIIKTRKNLSQGFSFTKFAEASDWLQNNTEPGEIIIHSDWDEWPLLFYHNSQNYYIVGLDPTFMYNYNQNLYWDWVHLTTGQDLPGISQFNSQYILLEKNHTKLDRNLQQNPSYILMHEDNDSKIYKK